MPPNTGSSRTAATPLRAGVICQKWRDNGKESRGPAAAAEPIRWAAPCKLWCFENIQ